MLERSYPIQVKNELLERLHTPLIFSHELLKEYYIKKKNIQFIHVVGKTTNIKVRMYIFHLFIIIVSLYYNYIIIVLISQAIKIVCRVSISFLRDAKSINTFQYRNSAFASYLLHYLRECFIFIFVERRIILFR